MPKHSLSYGALMGWDGIGWDGGGGVGWTVSVKQATKNLSNLVVCC